MSADPPDKSKPPLCFVIGPIGKDRSEERKHADFLLHAVIKPVLEGSEFGYLVKRADEDSDPGMIGDQVVTDILQAELVVADLTGLNPNAFYELGIRHATIKPTIHIACAGTLLPFDTISHRTIFVDLSEWRSIEQGRLRLADSARALKAPDFQVSNPITQANASFKMRESADPRDRVLAEMQERMAALETRLARPSPVVPTGRYQPGDSMFPATRIIEVAPPFREVLDMKRGHSIVVDQNDLLSYLDHIDSKLGDKPWALISDDGTVLLSFDDPLDQRVAFTYDPSPATQRIQLVGQAAERTPGGEK